MTEGKRPEKPAHMKEHIWQQHLQWMEVVSREAEENFKKMNKQSAERGRAGGASSSQVPGAK